MVTAKTEENEKNHVKKMLNQKNILFVYSVPFFK